MLIYLMKLIYYIWNMYIYDFEEKINYVYGIKSIYGFF